MESLPNRSISDEPRKEPVWNPLSFLPKEEDVYESINPYTVKSWIEKADTLVKEFGLPSVHFEKSKGMEVGDDRAEICRSPRTLALQLILQEQVFCMKTSWKDTFITNSTWNFCEVTSSIPSSPLQSMEACRRNNSMGNLGYSDAPVIRLITDVQKGDRSHSSSATGKSSMYGRRLSTPRRSNRPILMLGCWMQDGCLNTIKSMDPKYLPSMMGGSSCPALWDNPDNIFLYLNCYKNGRYMRVYGTAINEARTAVNSMDNGRLGNAILCSRLRDKQEYLHITYAANVLVPESKPIGSVSKPIQPLYKAIGNVSSIQSVERRLITARVALTKSMADIEHRRRIRINDMLLGCCDIKYYESKISASRRAMTEKYDFALQSNAAVQNLLNRTANGSEVQTLISEGFLNVGCGVLSVERSDTEWIFKGGKGEIFSLYDINSSEDIYDRRDVSLDETLKVPGITLKTVMSNKIYMRETIAKIGLWKVSETQEQWAQTIVNELAYLRSIEMSSRENILDVFRNHRDWLADDPLIMDQIAELSLGKSKQSIIVVTSDTKMCRQIAMNTGNDIVMVKPNEILRKFRQTEWSSKSIITIEDIRENLGKLDFGGRFPNPTNVIIDSGSLSAYASRVTEGIDNHGTYTGTRYSQKLLTSGITSEGRSSRILQQVVEDSGPSLVEIFPANGMGSFKFKTYAPTTNSDPEIRKRGRGITAVFSRRR